MNDHLDTNVCKHSLQKLAQTITFKWEFNKNEYQYHKEWTKKLVRQKLGILSFTNKNNHFLKIFL